MHVVALSYLTTSADYGFPFVDECYNEVATLQRANRWAWSVTLSEDVYTAWEEWSVPPTEIQLEGGPPLTTTSREVIYRWVLIHIYATHYGMQRLFVL